MVSRINWQAKWIAKEGRSMTDWRLPVQPAPWFRKVFTYHKEEDPMILISGVGYFELYINGRKVSDSVLEPVATQYDKRVRYLRYPVKDYLKEGQNVVGVVLGNGFYNPATPEVWHFDKAPWRDSPKFILQMVSNNTILLMSDKSWKCSEGPILFDQLRNGETYDARCELDGWLDVDFNDDSWKKTVIIPPPGGLLEEQNMPPCRVVNTLEAKESWKTNDGSYIYDCGLNISGWSRITLTAEPGTEITLCHSELIKEKELDTSNINGLILEDRVQTDVYICKGEGIEIWEPRFTYHGFRYAKITIKGEGEIKKWEARIVHTDFSSSGEFVSSDPLLNKLQDLTKRSFLSNFVGIPTDCPHREKNGWTGDAQLACETGLFNFDSTSSYIHWLESIVDAQRPDGQIPGIVPSPGWGYNWGSGPAWDSALVLIPYYLFLFTGNRSIVEKFYGPIKKYLGYLEAMAEDYIVHFGLGDWCHVDEKRIVQPSLTSTAYYFNHLEVAAYFASLLDKKEDNAEYLKLAGKVKTAFNRSFYRGNGIYGKGELTAMGCALFQGLVEEKEKPAVLAELVKSVRAIKHKADFGILGAKYVPRVLAENGYIDDAFEMITQKEFPGWGYWVEQGATALWESWLGDNSQNHIMFGDISAWMYNYIAGITPDTENPGFSHFFIKPQIPSSLEWAQGKFKTTRGEVISSWKKERDNCLLEITVPQDSKATLIFPSGEKEVLSPGTHIRNYN
jgi:alpha-L-rhamnosidase